MKLLTTVLGVALLTGCTLAPVEPVAPLEPVQLETVYTADGFTQTEIYDSVRQWFALVFRSANAVIQYEDKSTATIIGKGSVPYTCVKGIECVYGTDKDRLEFTIRVDTKDGKLKVTYENLVYYRPAHIGEFSGSYYKESRTNINPASAAAILNIGTLNSLSTDLVDKIKSKKLVKDNW
jgi:hypothetical protein